MAISVTHATAADGTFSATGTTAWNEAHSLAGLGTGVETALGVNVGSAGAVVVNGGALGTPSAGTLTNATGLPIGGISATGTPSVTTYLRGDGSWATVSGGAALSGITAAAAGNTIASGNNHSQIWNWALTSNSVNAFTFGETTAATGGTSTSGVPNQSILRLSTLAASTASPLRVDVRGAFAMALSPTTGSILVKDGSASAPPYSFAGDTDTGLYSEGAGGGISFAADGARVAKLIPNGGGRFCVVPGSAGAATVTDLNNSDSGLFWPAATVLGFSVGSIENSRLAAGLFQVSKGTADAVSYALNFRKSRGTVASPTVITTGDVLMSQSAFAYLGATNTYRETGRIEITSKGTISDATTGVGSIFTIYGKTQGTDATPQPVLVITDGSTASIKFAGTGMFTANATTACALTSVGPAGASTTVQTWLTITDSGGTVRYIPCF